MKECVYNFGVNIDWEMISRLSSLDRFDSAWETLADKDANQLRELKTIATIRSIGSSTRIEGSQMSNEQVEELLKNIKLQNLKVVMPKKSPDILRLWILYMNRSMKFKFAKTTSKVYTIYF